MDCRIGAQDSIWLSINGGSARKGASPRGSRAKPKSYQQLAPPYLERFAEIAQSLGLHPHTLPIRCYIKMEATKEELLTVLSGKLKKFDEQRELILATKTFRALLAPRYGVR